MNDVGSRCGFASFILPRYPKKEGPLDERPLLFRCPVDVSAYGAVVITSSGALAPSRLDMLIAVFDMPVMANT